MLTLGAAIQRRRDNFLPLRHLAALLVMYGHAYALAPDAGGSSDLLARWLPGFKAGSLAVYLFFVISGFLVTLSLLRAPGVLRYVRNRLLRVYPGYLACLLLTIAVLGPAFTALPLADYLSAAGTRAHLLQNLLPVTLSWTLPGVFADNPYPHVINGSLWSLGLEVRWYAYLGLLAGLTILDRRWAFTALAAGLLLVGAWEWWLHEPDVSEYRALSQTFLLAALCAHWRQRMPLSGVAMLAQVVLVALTAGTRAFAPLVIAAALYFTLWVAYALPPLPWPRRTDYSYGLFLYGFPVQQTLAALAPGLSPLPHFLLACALTLPLAALSWHLVERPALRWKAGPQGTLLPAV